MTRNLEDASLHLPDPSPLDANDTGGRVPTPDSVPLKPPAFPSVGTLGAELLRSNVIDSTTGLRLEPIPGNPHRHDFLSKASYRVMAGIRTLCHLTVGRNLAQLWERTQAFAGACPEIACQPLFHYRLEEWDCLGVEFFDGRNLDSLAREGRLTPAEALEHSGRIVAALERTLQPSNLEAAAQEIDALFVRVSTLPMFAEFDRSLLRQTIFPFVRAGALAGPLRTRWTNGDLIPRNVLVDQPGNVRLVDYEFAARTHFFAEDAWRWRTFSLLPPEARDLPGLGDGAMQETWLEAYFLLKQLVLAHEIKGAQQAAVDSCAFIDRLVTLAAERHPAFHANMFLQLLASAPKLKGTLQQKDQATTGDFPCELTRLRILLDQREKKIRAMQASFSWKVTTPLRALRRVFLDR
jgi:hypothetical protein